MEVHDPLNYARYVKWSVFPAAERIELLSTCPTTSLQKLNFRIADYSGVRGAVAGCFELLCLEKFTGAHVWRMLECLQSWSGRTTKSHLAGRHR